MRLNSRFFAHDGWAFEEVARRFGDFALASIAVAVRREQGGLADIRIGVMEVADTPLRMITVEQELNGTKLDDRLPDRFSSLVTAATSPNSDLHASAEYRKHLLGRLAKRAITTALAV